MAMERDLIKGTQFIISTTIDNVRSTGDVMSTGQTTYDFSRFDTIIVDAEYFEKYTQLISASGNRDMLDRVGAVSMDGLYVPYSTSPYHTGSLPHFEVPTSDGSGIINVYSLNPFNPSHMFGTGVINYSVPDTGVYDTGVWASGGHNITAALVNSTLSTNTTMEAGVHPVSSFFDADFYYRKKTELLDIRSVAHRAPLILSGPGYDTNGNPVPTGESGVMHPQAHSNPSLWKTGPLDVRWDDDRKVWTGGTGGAPRIRFTILSTAFTVGFGALGCDHVVVRVDHISCGGTGVEIGDEVNVYDPEYCHFNLPIELLIGLSGTATWMKSENYQSDVGYVVDCVTDLQNAGCMWMIDTLCCSEEEIISG